MRWEWAQTFTWIKNSGTKYNTGRGRFSGKQQRMLCTRWIEFVNTFPYKITRFTQNQHLLPQLRANQVMHTLYTPFFLNKNKYQFTFRLHSQFTCHERNTFFALDHPLLSLQTINIIHILFPPFPLFHLLPPPFIPPPSSLPSSSPPSPAAYSTSSPSLLPSSLPPCLMHVQKHTYMKTARESRNDEGDTIGL